MNRRRFQQLFLSIGTAGLCACTGMQPTKANSDFEGVKWKQFEARMLGKIIQFEFPVDVPGTTTFKSNSAFYSLPDPKSNDPNRMIIVLRTNEHIGWVNATSGVNIFIFINRYRGTNPDGSWTPYYEFSTTQDALDRIAKQERKRTNPSRAYSLVRLGNREWIKTVSFWLSGAHEGDEYQSILNRDYLLSVNFGLGTQGKPDEARLAELRKVGERIVASVRIVDEKTK